jgi:hypothetical protein
MPVKLPAPDEGTFEQAGPNGAEDVLVLAPVAAEDAPADAFGVAVGVVAEPVEPQAAAPSASPAASAVTARNLTLMIFLLLCWRTAAGCSGWKD